MKKAVAIILAFTVLLSNVGVALSTHFCGGMAIDRELSWGMADVGCGMEEEKASCQKPLPTDGFNTAPCCQDAHQLLQLEEPSEKAHSPLFEFQAQVAIAIIKALAVYFFPFFPKKVLTANTNYSPPPLVRDIQVFFQVFRI